MDGYEMYFNFYMEYKRVDPSIEGFIRSLNHRIKLKLPFKQIQTVKD